MKRIIALLVLILLCGACPLWAENEGLDNLDNATTLKLAATNLQDLGEVLRLAQSALDMGLDKENTVFAKKLMAGTLVQRGTLLANRGIFGPPQPDPRWPQLRQVALADLERALELEPEQPEANLLVGRLHALPGGDKKRALKALDAAVAAEDVPKDSLAEAYSIRAQLQPDAEKQLADHNKAVELAPEEADVVRARGLFYLAQGKTAEALADLEKALKLAPDDIATWEAQAQALLADEKVDQALESLAKAIKLSPDSAPLYLLRARVELVKNDLKAALADLDHVLKIEPGALAVLLLRARVHHQAGDLDKALADIDKALELQPGLLPARMLRAELYAASDKLKEAIAEMEALKQEHPTNVDIWFQLGRFCQIAERPRQAIEVYTSVLEGNADYWPALRSRADAYLSVGKHSEAVADYTALMKLKPDEEGALNNFAWVLATSPDEKIRDGKRALELALKACEASEYKAAHVLSTLAAAYAETRDFKNAIKWSKKAVEIGDESQKEELGKELASYEEGKPWREQQNVAEKPLEDTPKDQESGQSP